MSIFRLEHRVTYAECTAGNHVYYGRYLDLLEAARGEFFRELGTTFLQWQEEGTLFPVTECRLRYRLPARYDEMLSIELWVMRAEGARLEFGYRILNPAGALVLDGETFHACTGLNGRPKRLPQELGVRLRAWASE